LELSGEEFSKVSNSTLESIAEQELMTNSWRSTVVAKLAVIRAPDFSLGKVDSEVDVDSIVDAMIAKKKAEQRAAKERLCSLKGKTTRNSELQNNAVEVSRHDNNPTEINLAPLPVFGLRNKGSLRAIETTHVPNLQTLNQHRAIGIAARASFETTSALSLADNDWWAAMGIEGMEGTASPLVRQNFVVDKSFEKLAATAPLASTREFARATFGLKVLKTFAM
jgi:hypothetical protein